MEQTDFKAPREILEAGSILAETTLSDEQTCELKVVKVIETVSVEWTRWWVCFSLLELMMCERNDASTRPA